MNNINSDCFPDFIKCKSIWFLFLTELNWNPNAINPLELVPESFWPEVTDLLIEARYIGQNRNYYLRESDMYMNYLSKGGKPFNVKINSKNQGYYSINSQCTHPDSLDTDF